MKDNLLKWLYLVAQQNILFNIDHDVFSTYDDSCGQRQCYLEHYGYGSPNPELFPESFKVKRHLTFTNEEDKNKQGSVLICLNLKEVKNIELTEKSAKFNGLNMWLMTPVKYPASWPTTSKNRTTPT